MMIKICHSINSNLVFVDNIHVNHNGSHSQSPSRKTDIAIAGRRKLCFSATAELRHKEAAYGKMYINQIRAQAYTSSTKG